MRALAAGLAFLLAAGCLGPSEPRTSIGDAVLHQGRDVVLEGGALIIDVDGRYEVDGARLVLSPEPSVIVGGVIEVRGTFIARNATIENLFRITAFQGSTLVLENVTLRNGPADPSIFVRTADAWIVGSTLPITLLDVRAAAQVHENTITSRSTIPAILWAGAAADLVGNRVEAAGVGILLDRASGTVAQNVVRAGTGGITPGIGVRGGSVEVVGNRVLAASVGIGLEGAAGAVVGNTVENATTVGIGLVASSAAARNNTVQTAGRAGIYVENATGDVPIEGNLVERVGMRGAGRLEDAGAGIAVKGGAPRLVSNDLLRNDVGVAVLAGSPVLRQNNLEGNLRFGVVLVNVTGGSLDARENWWGSPAGPLPAAPAEPPVPTPSPPASTGERVGPSITYAPWLTARR